MTFVFSVPTLLVREKGTFSKIAVRSGDGLHYVCSCFFGAYPLNQNAGGCSSSNFLF